MKTKPRLLLITGLSGAGKHQLLYQLEDWGYFCVDNLPAPLILATLQCLRAAGKWSLPLALGVDVRAGMFMPALRQTLAKLKKQAQRYKIIFLEASEQELIRRFAESRRPHPLPGAKTLKERIHLEAKQLTWLREQSDLIMDTSFMTPVELRRQLLEWLGPGKSSLPVLISSFGYKYGLPQDADFVFDVRFLPNPFYLPALKKLNGHAPSIRRYVLQQPVARSSVRQMLGLLKTLVPQFVREGKNHLHIAVGCTGGQHRSVVIVNELQRLWKGKVMVFHRELARQAGGKDE